MRTLTTAQQTTLLGAHYRVSLRVWVEDSGGTLRNLSALNGRDWVDEVQWDEDIDQPVSQATVRLWREVQNESLAPYRQGSVLNQRGGVYTPLLEAGRELIVEVATTPVGVDPVATDWEVAFHGEIDEVDWGGSAPRVSLTARDLGGSLLDRFIEEERTYGTEAGVAVETVMQKILDDNLGAGVVTLSTPTSPGWMIKEFKQEKEALLEALRKLAGQIGWDVRYRWSETDGRFRLTFFDPGRAKTTIDWTFGPSRYLDVSTLRTSRAMVRNLVRVVYTDSADGKRKTVEVRDDASISRFGRRFMELEEDASSLIDTAAEAQQLADSVLTDLRDPKAEQEIELHFFWPAEIGDLYGFTANGIHYDSDQQWATVGVRHQLSREQQRTTLRVRGSVAGSYREWLRREVRVTGPAQHDPGNAILSPRVLTTAMGDAADLYVGVQSNAGEHVRLYLRDGDTGPVWALVRGAADSGARFAAPGTELGPDDWFHDGATFAQKLKAIPLLRDQVRRVFLQGEAQNSGASSTWVPVTLEARAQPWLESVDLTFDEGTDNVTLTAVGGAFCKSVRGELSEAADFSTIFYTVDAPLADGERKWVGVSVATRRNRTIYGRVTPYNGALAAGAVSGLAGQPQQDSEFVPASESGTQAPTASIRVKTTSTTSETLTFNGVLGAGGTGPLQWRYRVDVDNTGEGAWGAWQTTALPVDVAFTRRGLWEQRVVLQVQDAQGRIGEDVRLVTSSRPGLADDGRLRTTEPYSGGTRRLADTDEGAVRAQGGLAANTYEVLKTVPLARIAPVLLDVSNLDGRVATIAGTAVATVRDEARVGHQGVGLDPLNLVVNGGGQNGTTGWIKGAGSTLTSTTDAAKLGDRSLKLENITAADTWWYQDIPCATGEVYEVSGWIKTTALPAADPGQGAFLNVDKFVAGVHADLTGALIERQGTAGTVGLVDVGLPADGVARDWTFVRTVFRVDFTGAIRLILQLGYWAGQSGTAWFDGVRVERRTAYEVEGRRRVDTLYDADGRLATAVTVQDAGYTPRGLLDVARRAQGGLTAYDPAANTGGEIARAAPLARIVTALPDLSQTTGHIATIAGTAAATVRDQARVGQQGVGSDALNLVVNGGGQDGTVGWMHGTGIALTSATDAFKFGDRSLKLDHSTGMSDSWWYQDIPCTTGEVYEVSAWIKTTALPAGDPGHGAFLNVDKIVGGAHLDLSGTLLERQGTAGPVGYMDVGLPADGVARDWTFVRILFRVDFTGVIRLMLQFGYGGLQSGAAWFDGVRVERRTGYEVEGRRRVDTLYYSDGSLRENLQVHDPGVAWRNLTDVSRRSQVGLAYADTAGNGAEIAKNAPLARLAPTLPAVNPSTGRLDRGATAHDGSRIASEEAVTDPGNLIYNPSFESDANSDGVADGWTPNFEGVSWGYGLSTSARHGKFAQEQGPGGSIACAPFRVHAGERYRFGVSVFNLSATVKIGFYFRVCWYGDTNDFSRFAAGQYNDIVSGDTAALNIQGWTDHGGVVEAPSWARFCRVALYTWSPRTDSLRFDQAYAYSEDAYEGRRRVDTLYRADRQLQSGVMQHDGAREVKLAQFAQYGTTQDGNAVNFSPAFQNVPVVQFGPGQVTYDPALGAVRQRTVAEAVGLTPSGFTARLKVRQADTVLSTNTLSPSSGVCVKYSSTEAYDDAYVFNYSVTVYSYQEYYGPYNPYEPVDYR